MINVKIPFEQNLIAFSKSLTCPLFAVGGYVRNFLIGGIISDDVDLSSCVDYQEFKQKLSEFGFYTVCEYPRTGTIVFSDGKIKYEFTKMRKDSYTGGAHKPTETLFTDDITEDALRRDFKCNAVYYNLSTDKIVDPLGGIDDIKNKRLCTVKNPDEVFCNDGLRLMRLARFSGELGFAPTQEVLSSAEKFSDNIKEIAVERITEELKRILVCDEKYSFSDKVGHYTALKVLADTRVLDKILPELTLGRGIEQRKDYHNYDVLEHTLRTVMYADKSVRISALFHDVAKPKLFNENGNFYKHDKVGKALVGKVMKRLKFDNKTISETQFLTEYHMLDMDLKVREKKLIRFFVDNYSKIDKLLKLKQADFSGSKDDLSVCPTVLKWQEILSKMQELKVPLTVKDLKICAKDIIDAGFSGKEVGAVLTRLFDQAVINPEINERERLLSLIDKYKNARSVNK